MEEKLSAGTNWDSCPERFVFNYGRNQQRNKKQERGEREMALT